MVVIFAWTEPYLCSFVNPVASALDLEDFRRPVRMCSSTSMVNKEKSTWKRSKRKVEL